MLLNQALPKIANISQRLMAAVFVFSALFVIFSLFAPKSYAAISFVGNIAVANDKTSGTSLVLTVPAAGVASGDSIIISTAFDFTCVGSPISVEGTITSIVDTAGNTYTKDLQRDNDTSFPVTSDCADDNATFSSEVWSAHNVAALSNGNTITLTWNNATVAKAATAGEYSGLAALSTKDQISDGIGSDSSPVTAATGTTSQANELLIGSIAVEGPSGDTFTNGGTYTDAPPDRTGTSGSGPSTNVTINPEYRIVSSMGTYTADGTLSTNRNWIAMITTYRGIGALDHYGVTVASPQTAGVCVTGTNTVTAQDADDNTIITDTSTVNMTSSGTGVTFYTTSGCSTSTTQYTLSSGVTNIYYKTNTAQSFTITATKDGSTETGTSSSITVNPGTHTRLVVTLPGETFTAGSGNSGNANDQAVGIEFTIPSITATDDYFNVITSYSGSKTLSYSGPSGSPSYTTSVEFTSGQSTTPLLTTLNTLETTTITATDGGSYGYASSSLTVNPIVIKTIQGGVEIKGGTSIGTQ